MSQNFTIEEIQTQLNAFKQRIDAVEEAFDELLTLFERESARPNFDVRQRKEISTGVHRARHTANDLVRQFLAVDDQIVEAKKAERHASQEMLMDALP